MEMHCLTILKSSFTLIILIFLSVLSVTFAIERWWYIRGASMDSLKFMEKIQALLEKGSFNEAISLCDRNSTKPLANIVRVGIENRKLDAVAIEELMESKKMEERMKLDRFLGILGTLGNTAPFIGLFGTVVGIIKAFRDLAASGSGGPSVVAVGIAEALVATAGGLAVAIHSVVVFNYFNKKVKNMVTEMDVAMKRLLVYMGK